MPQSYTLVKGKRTFCDPKRFLYNVDTFWFNVDAANYDDVIGMYYEKFCEGRSRVLDGDEELLTVNVKLPFYDNPCAFQIQNGQPPVYSFSIRSEDMAFYFAKKKRSDNLYPIKVQINQAILWEKGIIDAYEEALLVLINLNFDVYNAKLNRIDYAVHTDQFQFNYFDMKKFYYPVDFRGLSKPKMDGMDLDRDLFETFMVGNRSRRQMRIYYKSAEILVHNKHYFYDIYEKNGLRPDMVWNIELELRRPFFKDLVDDGDFYMCDDLNEFFKNDGLGKLWKRAIEDYGFDKSAFWSTLLNNKNNDFNWNGYSLLRKKRNDWSIDREVGQIVGRLKKFLLYENDTNLGNAMRVFVDRVPDYLKKRNKNFDDMVKAMKLMYQNDTINNTITISKEKSKVIKWVNS